jgi:threonine synthase
MQHERPTAAPPRFRTPSLYLCPACHRRYPLEALVWRCECGSHLEWEQGVQPTWSRADIDSADASLWRYEAMLPVPKSERRAFLGEGWTPLIEASERGLLLKLDFLMPTGSFKDRGSTILMNHLARLGVREVLEDSSGNAGASIAAYAAGAGIACEVYVPASASGAKLAQIASYGARLVAVPGSRQEVTDAAVRREEALFYASHNWHPLFGAGTSTLGFELWEQLGFRAPDAVVTPVGAGSTLLGCWRAFKELAATEPGLSMPRLYAAQAAACAPLVAALAQGEEIPSGVEPGETRAEGVKIGRPIRGRELVTALRASGGGATAVTEDEIAAAQERLGQRGIFVEPTGAVAYAAALRLLTEGQLGPAERVAVILTGSGLKSAA